jgi:hypothetical protein
MIQRMANIMEANALHRKGDLEMTAANSQGPSIVTETPTKTRDKTAKKKADPERERSGRILPTSRITFEKQLDILRAYAAASADGTRAARVKEVAGIVELAEVTLSMANPFLTNVGLIQKGEAGFTPAPEVLAFLRAYQWNKETASFKIAPIIQKSWFANALLPKLTFGDQPEKEAIAILAEAATAGPGWRKELTMLLDYMKAAGLIRREGGFVKIGSVQSVQEVAQPAANQEASRETPSGAPDSPKARVLTEFTQSAEGAVNFNVSVRVNMAELGGWKADRISAFFNGIAEVLAAKAGIEKAGS